MNMRRVLVGKWGIKRLVAISLGDVMTLEKRSVGLSWEERKWRERTVDVTMTFIYFWDAGDLRILLECLIQGTERRREMEKFRILVKEIKFWLEAYLLGTWVNCTSASIKFIWWAQWVWDSTKFKYHHDKNSLINPIIQKNAVYILGSIYPWGKLTRSAMQKANTNVESNSIRKQSHSIAAILQKNGRAKLSSRYRFLFIKRFSWQKPLIIAAPAIDSPKRWITGDFCMLRIRTSSLDDDM